MSDVASQYRLAHWMSRSRDGLRPREGFRIVSVTFHLTGEHISHASLGLNDLRCARVVLQFAAKAENLHVNAPIEHVLVDPGRLQKILSAKRPLRSAEERDKQRVFAFGQRDVRAGLSGILCVRLISSLSDEPFAEDDGELGLGLEPLPRSPLPFLRRVVENEI